MEDRRISTHLRLRIHNLLQKGAPSAAKKNIHAFSDISVTIAILADGEDRYEV
jgi:hypothetical protein